MSGGPNARWSTEWLETLDGDRLRELSKALFSRIGYHVHSMDSPCELDFELSQEAPMAPRVGLCCRADAEGIDIPLLRKIDAAVAQNDHGFGIVAKNGKFRPEEKMFAQGKPLQLIDSDEFVKRLDQLPPEQQDVIFAEFAPPPPPSPNRQDSTGAAAKGAGGTPDFIKKLENLPGFGNKRTTLSNSPVRDSSSPSPQTRVAESRPTEPSLASSGSAAPVKGLNLSKPVPSPAPAAAKSPPPSLTPMSQCLPSIQPLSRRVVTPGPPAIAGGPANLARPADPDPIASAGAGRGIASLAAAAPEPQHAAGETLPRPGTSEDRGTISPAPAPTSPGSGNPSTPQEKGLQSPKPSGGSAIVPPVSAASNPPDSRSTTGTDPESRNTDGESSPFPSPQPLTNSDSTSAIPDREGDSSLASDETARNAPTEPSSPRRKNRAPALAVAAVFLFLIPVIGGFFAFKFVFGTKPKEIAIPETPAQLQLPEIDHEEIENLTQALAERVAELKQATAGIEGREIAMKVASEATRALQAGIDFVELGNNGLPATIAAIVEGEVVDDPENPDNAESFGFLNLGEVTLELIANYLVIEDDILKFSMEERDPRLAVQSGNDAATGEELLVELETLLNKQNVVGAQANAKSIADVAAAAKAAGLDFTGAGRRNIEKTIAAIVSGETVSNHVETGEDLHFGLPNLSEKAQRAAASYLQFSQGELVYVSDPLPAPQPAFDLIGKDILYDLERAESIAEKAVAHVQGRLSKIEAAAAELAKAQEAILALTGEPEKVTFSSGSIAFSLPRDFNYELEDEDSVIITPKFAPNKEAVWVRVRLQSPEVIRGPDGELGIPRLRSLAKSLGRPVEQLGDKIFYWKNDEILEGDLLYWVTLRHIGFGNTIVTVADATARGMESLPEVTRMQEVLPTIITSLRETGVTRRELESVDARETAPRQSEKVILPGRAVPR